MMQIKQLYYVSEICYSYLKLSFNSQFQAYVPDKWGRDVSRFDRIGFVYKPPRACGLSFLNPLLKFKKKLSPCS